MDFTVEVECRTEEPLTEDKLLDIAEIGGAASGSPGGTWFGTTLTVEGNDKQEAISGAMKILNARVLSTLIEGNAMTTTEFDRLHGFDLVSGDG